MATRHLAGARLVDNVPVLGHAFRATPSIRQFRCARCGIRILVDPDGNPTKQIERIVTTVNYRCEGWL